MAIIAKADPNPMEIVDLKFHQQYLPQLALWHQAEWGHLNPGETLDQRMARMQSYLSEIFIPTMFIAKQDDELLGSAAIVEHDMETWPDSCPWLACVYVAAEHRRRGIGAALVRHAMNQALEDGWDSLYLFTPSQERFYQGLGWRSLAYERYRETDVTVMQFSC